MMTPLSDRSPERLPLPPGFARSAAWPVLHVGFPGRVAHTALELPHAQALQAELG